MNKLWIFHLEVDNRGRLKTNLYDIHDDFPFISINISASPQHGVYILQLIHCSKVFTQYCGQSSNNRQKATEKGLRCSYVKIISSSSGSNSNWYVPFFIICMMTNNIGNWILVQSWLLLNYYVFQWVMVWWYLTPFSTILQLYHGRQFIGGGNRVPRENHRLAASHWQTLSHSAVSSTPLHQWNSN